MRRLGLIAGGGDLPLAVAHRCEAEGREVFVIRLAGFADPAVPAAIAALYAPHAILLSEAEQAAFAGNAIALSPDVAWMSEGAAHALSATSRGGLAQAGFALRDVALDAIEAAGGSLRCCVAEIY